MMIFRPSNSAAGGPTYMYLDRYRLTGHCTYPTHFIHGSCSSPTPIHCEMVDLMFSKSIMYQSQKRTVYNIAWSLRARGPCDTSTIRACVYAARSHRGASRHSRN